MALLNQTLKIPDREDEITREYEISSTFRPSPVLLDIVYLKRTIRRNPRVTGISFASFP